MSSHEFAYFPFAGGRGEAIRCASLRGVAQYVTQRDVAATCFARRKWGGAAGRWRRRSGARWACRHAGALGCWAVAPPEWRALGVPPCRGAGALGTPHCHMPNLIHCMTAQNRHPRVENRVQAHGPGVRRLPKAEGGHKGQCVAQRYTDTESNDSHASGTAAATGPAARSVCADTTKPSWIVSSACAIPSAYSKHVNLVSKTIF
jgi:hypothetical protein